MGNSFCLVAQCRVIGTCLAGLRKNDVPKDLEHFWMGHEDEEIGDRYSKLKDVVAFRKERKNFWKDWLGFRASIQKHVVGPNGPKIDVGDANCWL